MWIPFSEDELRNRQVGQPCRNTRGVILLEALVSLALVSTAGLAFAGLVREVQTREERLMDRERRLLEADRVLTAMSLLGRSDLDRRLGHHLTSGFTVEVQRPEPALYRVSVAETDAPEVELLVTIVYRPAPRTSWNDRDSGSR